MLAISDRWAVDKKGKRRLGSMAAMYCRLTSAIDAMLAAIQSGKSIDAEFWARHAAHWALALKGK